MDITFFDNVELCELGIPSMVIHEYDNFLCALGLLRACKEKILNSSVEFHTRDHCWDVSQHICKMHQHASAAFLDPIALVQTISRMHTVGGAEFPV